MHERPGKLDDGGDGMSYGVGMGIGVVGGGYHMQGIIITRGTELDKAGLVWKRGLGEGQG